MSWRDELDISVVNPAPSHGGQKVGPYNYPVKIVHLPTQTTAICGHERSQHKK